MCYPILDRKRVLQKVILKKEVFFLLTWQRKILKTVLTLGQPHICPNYKIIWKLMEQSLTIALSNNGITFINNWKWRTNMFNERKTIGGPWRCVTFWWQHIYKYRLPRNLLQLAQELQPALQRPSKAPRSIIVQVKWLKARSHPAITIKMYRCISIN